MWQYLTRPSPSGAISKLKMKRLPSILWKLYRSPTRIHPQTDRQMVKPLYPHAHPYVLCVGYNNPLNMFTWKCPRQNVCNFVQASMYSDCTTETAQLKILVFLIPLFTNRNWLIQHRDSVMDMWLHPRKGWNAITHPCLNFNTDLTYLPPGQDGRHFADDIFRCIFANEKFHILIKISLKFVPKGPNDNNPALVQIMTWRRIGDKRLFDPMLTRFIDAYIYAALGGNELI